MKTKPQIKNYLDTKLIPSTNLIWTSEDDIIILQVENKGFFNRLAQNLFHQPRISYISLDNYGSTLWGFLDGKNSVYNIIEKMKESFPDEKEKMLDRVIDFLHTLKIHGYIVEK